MMSDAYHCSAYNDDNQSLVAWIALISGNCVYGNVSAISWSLGWLSFGIWLCAQLPQVLENYMNKSVEGLSLSFLTIWFIGDVTNFIGCILTSQLPFQTALSLYYICIDAILLSQYVYYTTWGEPWYLDESTQTTASSSVYRDSDEAHSSSNAAYAGDSNEHNDVGVVTEVPIEIARARPSSSPGIRALITSSFVASFSRVQAMPIPVSFSTSFSSSSVLETLEASKSSSSYSFLGNSRQIGTISAWICAFMYLSSRLPQIYKNFRRQSTWGTSIHLFVAALCGNLTYALSVALSQESRGPNARAFFLNELPYLLGSAGTVVFDSIIFLQHCIYGKKHPRMALASGLTVTVYVPSDVNVSSAPIRIQHHHLYQDSETEDDETTPLAYSLQSQYHTA